jgi:hypothetical protein
MTRTEKLYLSIFIQLVLAMVVGLAPLCAQEPNRTELPIPDSQYKYPGKVPHDSRDAKFPPIKELKPRFHSL